MENSLKQRIIGAVVLIALAIIFLPAILKDTVNSGTFESKIPAQPEELARYRVNTQKIDELVAKPINLQKQSINQNESTSNEQYDKKNRLTGQADQIKKSELSTEISTRKTKQKEDASSKVAQNLDTDKPDLQQKNNKISEKYQDAAWVIQVASFSKQSNAENMVNQLKKNSYKAYRRKVQSDNRAVFRVFVGPYIEMKTAQKMLLPISQLSESKAILKPFDPIKH